MEKTPATSPIKLGLFFAALLAAMVVILTAHIGSETTLYTTPWVPSINITFALQLDGLSTLFALMISGIGVLVFIYSSIYMRGQPHTSRFFITLFCFALSMLGVVLADNIILLFVFWELTSLTSYLLIGSNHESEIARRNALQALLVTGSGGLVMFAGLMWMGIETGSFLLSDILAAPEVMLASPYITPILLLILVGCFTKSAQFPLHFWLPNAMVAPTPVSTYLHSATMVKAGIYLIARLQPAFGLHEYWTPILATVGAITAIWASLLALKQDDLKQLLAYTTLMALGTLTFLLAFPSGPMAVAAMTFMLAHALYKATLFMVVGIIDQHTGTRKRSEISGLGIYFPKLKLIALGAALSMAGIPLFIGFLAKEASYSAMSDMPYAVAIAIVLVVANALMIIAAYLVGVHPFSGELGIEVKNPKPPHFLLWTPAALLVVLGIAFGTVPWLMDGSLIQPAATALLGFETNAPLSLWHGFSLALLLSIITLTLGAIGIRKYEQWIAPLLKILCSTKWSMERLYFAKLKILNNIARAYTQHFHNGSVMFYVRAVLVFIVASILSAVLVTSNGSTLIPSFPVPPDWIGVSLSFMAVVGALIAAGATSKIMALASLGASGFAMAGIFLLHGALDVAMTQLLVETLVVVLAAAVLWRLPDFPKTADWDTRNKKVDLAIAASAGMAVYLVLCSVLSQPLDLSITYFYENASFALAHGQNIVNVILVDFRAFDTFGEAVVIAVAAIGVWAMTKPLVANVFIAKDDL